MPNTFGTSNAAYQFPLVDPRPIMRARSRFLRDEIPELADANSLSVPAGRRPARGWILLSRANYNTLKSLAAPGFSVDTGLYSTAFQLQIDECMGAAGLPALTFKNLSIVQARCVTTGKAADEAAVYLIELTDLRGAVANRWFQPPAVKYYNVRSPAYPDNYYTDSL